MINKQTNWKHFPKNEWNFIEPSIQIFVWLFTNSYYIFYPFCFIFK